MSKLDQLKAQLVHAEARCYDPNWIVRMDARKDVEKLKTKIERAERRAWSAEQKRPTATPERISGDASVF